MELVSKALQLEAQGEWVYRRDCNWKEKCFTKSSVTPISLFTEMDT